MAVLRFYVDIEVKEEVDEPPSEETKAAILAEMEEVVGKRGYDLYDSGTEDDED